MNVVTVHSVYSHLYNMEISFEHQHVGRKPSGPFGNGLRSETKLAMTDNYKSFLNV